MDLSTTIIQSLQGAGWESSKTSGFRIKVTDQGNCVEYFGWAISTYRAAVYLFLGSCVEVKLFWGKICRSDRLGLNMEGLPIPQMTNWVSVGADQFEHDDCKLDNASEVDRAYLVSMFLDKLGQQFPNK